MLEGDGLPTNLNGSSLLELQADVTVNVVEAPHPLAIAAASGSAVPEAVRQCIAQNATPLTHAELAAAEAVAGGGEVQAASLPCLDAIMDQIGVRRWVLMGEATHGTHEFYALRSALTRRLVEERGFLVVAVEGEWDACFRVNRFLRQANDDSSGIFPSQDATLDQALACFNEFPRWMWRNKDIEGFLGWVKSFNSSSNADVRWYGLDLQGCLKAPAEYVVRYSEQLDPTFAQKLRHGLAPFFAHSSSSLLGKALAEEENRSRSGRGGAPTGQELERTLEALLSEMQRRNRDDFAFLCPVEEALSAEQCLDVLLSGQEYYRKQYTDGGVTWNLRDQHMVSTIMRLAEHLDVHSTQPPGSPPPGVVIWAHNSHIGDARASDRGKVAGHWNLGHMVRETFGADQTFLLGFTTYDGAVHAAAEWGQDGSRHELKPAQSDSWEGALHEQTLRLRATSGIPSESVAGISWCCGAPSSSIAASETLPHRLVGVVYKPEAERESHCSLVEIGAMYDAVLHVETTTPVTATC